jgi:ankyrin repeat protein
MIENGSDVHQGGDGPLMRAALRGERIPMMELLVAHGADVNAEWNGDFPILFAPCESVNPAALRWLLEHGANPDCPKPGRRDTALDYLIGSYARSPALAECIDLLVDAGGSTRYDLPGVLDLLRGRTESLAALLIDRGASVNVRATVDQAGVGGQTPIFHAVTQFRDYGLPVTRLLLERGADLSVRVRLPGHYENPGEVVECTPLEYAERFPGKELPNEKALCLLRRFPS